MANTRSFKPVRPVGGPKDEKTTASRKVDVEDLVGESQPVEPQPSSSYDSPQPRYSNSREDYGNQNEYQPRAAEGEPRFQRDTRPSYSTNREPSQRDVPTEKVAGYLDVMPEGHGFLRPKYIPSDKDVYISASQIRRFNLRPGDYVEGGARLPKENERYYGLLQVEKVNSEDSEKFVSDTGKKVKRTRFEDLTAIYPNRHIKLETGKTPLSQRVIDLISPIGFGQRALVVSPPKAGKTTILKDI